MNKTKKVAINLTVNAPVKMKPERVAKLIGMCIEIGMNDAAESVDLGDLEAVQDAKDALSLEFEEPTAMAVNK